MRRYGNLIALSCRSQDGRGNELSRKTEYYSGWQENKKIHSLRFTVFQALEDTVGARVVALHGHGGCEESSKRKSQKTSLPPNNAAVDTQRNPYISEPVDLDAPVERGTGTSLVGIECLTLNA